MLCYAVCSSSSCSIKLFGRFFFLRISKKNTTEETMRTVEGSNRGGRGYRGRGRGGGGMRGRGGGEDKRFTARLTDPRFSTATVHRGRGGFQQRGRGNFHNARDAAMKTDPRFAKFVAPTENEEEDDEEEEEDEEDDSQLGEEGEEMSDTDFEGEEDEDEEIDEDELAALDDDAAAWSGSDIEICEATKRVAIVNCDWDHVHAVDIFAILFHSLPLGGQLKSVKLYLSDFGKKMIELEKTHGPDLWVKKGEEDVPEAAEEELKMEPLPDDEDDDEGEVNSDDGDGWVEDNAAMINEVGENGEMFSSGKHRKYEKDRMKYYYAVATFDSADTASAVYHEIDGMDIESSGVTLDLRYIDDDETFDEPTETCVKIPPKFKPLSSFKSSALSQTNFRISWDQDDARRHQTVRDSFTGTTEVDDLAAYIAQDSSEDDELDPTAELKRKRRDAKRLSIRRKYAELLADIGGIPDEMPSDGDDEEKASDEEKSDDGDDESDDDDLNRFSDVDEDDDVVGDMEATIDFDADTKAQQLQRDLNRSRQMQDADLGTQAQLKYKMKRKESKSAKRESLAELRVADKEALEAQRAGHRKQLHATMGDLLENEREHRSGKEKRKAHAKVKKEEAAKEREDKKRLRVANALGISASSLVAPSSQQQAPQEALDKRFAGKLVEDPRFHIDVARQDRKKSNEEVKKLASSVVKAKQQRSATPATSSKPSSSTTVDADVDYFLNRPQKKSRKEH
ncbi:Hypothetical protein, putative [Bodo saltans]|uniref:ESF1 RRM domain-containing protein n=1 Tax=Bodo saltans TaxID=75058 RepID=A0A0S4IQI8_BODSA|nr:Hypothetical protein, putative [Bodo saltans]|eukprot:CUF96225.1 Hypothetical protein, putative [Bodo saltans]